MLKYLSVAQIGLERPDLQGQLLDPGVEAAQMSLPLLQVASEYGFSARTAEKYTHGVSRNVGYAARAGDRTQAPESRVLFFGEPDTDHPRTRFQDCHVVGEGGPRRCARPVYLRIASEPKGAHCISLLGFILTCGIESRKSIFGTGFAPVTPMGMGELDADLAAMEGRIGGYSFVPDETISTRVARDKHRGKWK